MFNKPGRKLKTFVSFIFWLLLALGIVVIFLGVGGNAKNTAELIIAIIGGLISLFAGSLLIFAFGQLVDDVETMKKEQANRTKAEIEQNKQIYFELIAIKEELQRLNNEKNKPNR